MTKRIVDIDNALLLTGVSRPTLLKRLKPSFSIKRRHYYKIDDLKKFKTTLKEKRMGRPYGRKVGGI